MRASGTNSLMLRAATLGLTDMMLGTAAMAPTGARSVVTSNGSDLYTAGLMASVEAVPMPIV